MNFTPTTTSSPPSSLARLQSLAKPRAPQEHCDLCGVIIPAHHSHLLELQTRQLACACEACAILFSSDQAGQYRRVPRRVLALPDLRLCDATWESLHIPINLAFFYNDGATNKMTAVYPSPAGPMHSVLSLDALDQLISENPALAQIQLDVESLLVNRIGNRRDAFIVPIDACYRLVGLIRSHWHGLSGGKEVWEEIERFFDNLYQQTGATRSATHA